MVALVALVYHAAFQFTAGRNPTDLTIKPIQPTQLIQCLLALGFVTALFEKLVQSETFFKLGHIFRHDEKAPIYNGSLYANPTDLIVESRR